MIRHIVLFKFKNNHGPENLDRIRNEMKSKLDALPDIIDVIKYFDTGVNINPIERAWDLVLVSEFESMEDLEIYRGHPAHQQAVEFFSTVKEQSASVDYEF